MIKLFIGILSTLICVQTFAASPASWKAYREARFHDAGELLRKDLKTNPQDAEALMLLILFNEHLPDGESTLKLTNRLLQLDEVPANFIYSFSSFLFPLKVDQADRKLNRSNYKLALENPKLSRALKNELAIKAASVSYIEGSPEKCMKSLQEIPSITEWSYIGRFRNILGSGFEKALPAHTDGSFDSTFENEFGAPVSWAPMLNTHAGVANSLAYYMDTQNAITLAQSFISIPSAGTYTLNLAAGGSVKVFIDDAEVFSQEEELSTSYDHIEITTHLEQGVHRFLLQLGAAERSEMFFFARLTDASGDFLSVYDATSNPRPYSPKSKLEAKVSYDDGFTSAQQRANSADASFFDKLNYVYCLLKHGRFEEGRIAINSLRETDELVPIVIDLHERLLSIEDNDAGITELQGMLREIRPNDTRFIVERYQDALQQEDYAAALKEIEALEKHEGLTERVLLAKMSIEFSKNNLEEGIKLINESHKKNPSSTTSLWLKYRVQNEMYNNKVAAKQVIKEYLNDYNDEEVTAELANIYAQDGHRSGQRGYESLLATQPNKIGYRENLYEIHLENKDYKDALAVINDILAQAPHVSNYYEMKGNVLKRMKREDEALKAYNRSLELGPNQFDLRSKIREINGEKPVYSLLDSVDVIEIIEELGTAFDDSEESIAMLTEDVRRVIYEDGVSEKKVTRIYKVLNEKGIDVLKEYNLSGVKIFDAQLIKPSLTRIDAERNGGNLVFPKIEVGDYVYVSYRERDYNYGKLLGHFWESLRLNAWFPVGRNRYQILAPEGYDFSYETTQTDLKPEKRTAGGYDYYTWISENPPVIESELYMPPNSDVAQVLHLSSIPDWNFISEWYTDLSATRTKADYAVKSKVEELFPNGYNALDENERVEKIYNFIVQEIDYSSLPFRQSAYVPQRAAKTLATQLGDCKDMSSLFVAMSREVEVDARLVLVDTRDNGEKDLVLPTMMFNHCIVQLNSSGDYLELTDKYLPFRTVGNELANSIALPIQPVGSVASLSNVSPSKKLNGMGAKTYMKFIESKALINRRSTYYGVMASNERHSFYKESRTDQEESLRRRITHTLDKTFELNDFNFEKLEGLGDTVAINMEISVDGVLSKLQNLEFFQIPWSMQFGSTDLIADQDRANDLCLWLMSDADRKRETFIIELPTGKALLETPKNVTHSYDGLTYELTFTQEGNRLIAERDYRMNRDNFNANEFDAVKDFVKKLREADEQLIGLK